MPEEGRLTFADVMGTPIPVPGRAGLRDLTYDDVYQAFRAAMVLFLVGGAGSSIVYLFGRNDFAHPAIVLVVSISALVVGLTYLVTMRYWFRFVLPHAPVIVHTAIFTAGSLISMALYGAGPDRFMIATAVYLQPLIFASYLMRRPLAFAHISAILVEFGLALAFGAPVSHPVIQWIFLMLIGSSGAFVLGRLADTASATAKSEYEARTALAEINDTLEHRVAEQVQELEGLTRLRRFLPRQIADVVAADSLELLAPHRRAIAVLFCDLRGFTAFAASAEPEDVVEVLGEYYAVTSHHLDAHSATFGSFAGDGIMAYFNDPLPVEEPAVAALDAAVDLAGALEELVVQWRHLGHELNFGIGITYGHATIGVVGHQERSEYTALGSVVNLAARLSDQAAGGQILVDGRAANQLGEAVRVRPAGERVLKGMAQPIAVFEAIRP
jgi:class 3 adenylate cyclase